MLHSGLRFLVLAVTLCAPRAAAQTPSDTEVPEGALRVDMTAVHPLFSPNRPIRVRFTVQNTTDQPVELPLPAGHTLDVGVALPLEFVFGTPDEPALSVAFRDEKPLALTSSSATPVVAPPGASIPQEAMAESGAPASDPAESAPTTLRLGPHGFVGRELDMRDFFPAMRYDGPYRLEWRPFGGRHGTASTELRVEPRHEAILVTDKGKITFALLYDEAPRNVANFLELVRNGFYDGKTFHRIVPEFLAQGGDPRGDGSGIRPDGRLIPAEFHDAPVQAGTLVMARKPNDPNSASCQFFVALARLPELDGQYTVIGQASDEESMRTLRAIAAEPTDRHYRPRIPLVIRSINLFSVDEPSVTRFDARPARRQALPAATTTAEAAAKP